MLVLRLGVIVAWAVLLAACSGVPMRSSVSYRGYYGHGPWWPYYGRTIIVDPCPGGDCGGIDPDYPVAVPYGGGLAGGMPEAMPMPDMGMGMDMGMPDMGTDAGGFDFD